MRSRPRLLAAVLVVVLVVVLVAVAGAVWSWSHRPQHVVIDDPKGDHRAVTYQDVRVVIPASWERRDLDGCEFRFEHWSPPSASHCDTEQGVSFYASATFDPATGPGVRRSRAGAATAWSGYVLSHGVAVYAADDSRRVVAGVLGSVEPRQ